MRCSREDWIEKPDIVVRICNPSTWETEAEGSKAEAYVGQLGDLAGSCLRGNSEI